MKTYKVYREAYSGGKDKLLATYDTREEAKEHKRNYTPVIERPYVFITEEITI